MWFPRSRGYHEADKTNEKWSAVMSTVSVEFRRGKPENRGSRGRTASGVKQRPRSPPVKAGSSAKIKTRVGLLAGSVSLRGPKKQHNWGPHRKRVGGVPAASPCRANNSLSLPRLPSSHSSLFLLGESFVSPVSSIARCFLVIFFAFPRSFGRFSSSGIPSPRDSYGSKQFDARHFFVVCF